MWQFKRRADDERDLDDEIQFHLDEETRLRTAAGATSEDAGASARRAFGNVTLVREVTRDMWGRRTLDALIQDLRLGFRLLARHRLFAVFSIVSLALGIGGTSAIFSLYDAIVLRALPVHEPDRLVTFTIHQQGNARPNSFMPYPQFERMHQAGQSLEAIFARSTIPAFSVGARGVEAMASGLAVTGDYHRTLGVRPALGRLLTPADDRAGHAGVAVISHAYWQRRFGASPAILGETVTLNQTPFVVVGVEPPGFFGVAVGAAPDVTIPLRASGLLSGTEPPWNSAFGTWIEIMGRLRDGVSVEQAAVELDAIFRQVSLDAAGAAAPESDEARFARETHLRLASGATGGVSNLRDGYEYGLRLLLMLLGGVLCLASLNVAALVLSRSEARRDEVATRLALGAGRGRIVRQFLTESVVIAACGGALGLWLAWRGSEALLRLVLPNAIAMPLDLSPDLRVVAFTSAVCLASCLVFGLLPAVRTTAMTRSSRGELGGRRRRVLDRAMVMAQTAVALVLVVCAGLFLQSLQRLWTQETGYDRRDVLMFSIHPGLAGIRGPGAVEMHRRVLTELRTLAAAHAVTLSTVRPVSDTYYFVDRVTQVGDRVLIAEDQAIRIAFSHLGPGYFETMGIPLIAGRDFEWRDGPEAQKVVIVSEQLARHFSGNPVGQHLTLGQDDVREVVGVAADTRYARVQDAPREVAYVPFFQQTPGYPPTYEIKYAGSTAEILRDAGEAVARIDPRLVLFRAKTLEDQTRESFARERLLAGLTTYFGVFAWLLAGIGLYGLLACTVTQRAREFGLRMALGAQPGRIRWAVMRESAGTVVIGLAIGVAGALMGARLIRTQLYGVEPTDPTTMIGAVVALLGLALVASFIPARRASRIDPMTALRQE